eukprot:210331_1
MDRDICSICIKYVHIPCNIIPFQTNCPFNTKLYYSLLSNVDIIDHYYTKMTLFPSWYLHNWLSVYHGFHHGFHHGLFHSCLQQLKDNKLKHSLLLCAEFTLRHNKYDNNSPYFAYEVYNAYLDIIIAICKKCINIKYNYISHLITMYECYYLDIYVYKVRPISELAVVLDQHSNEIRQMFKINLNLNENAWNNLNAMRMNSLLQSITIIHKKDIDSIMTEVDRILDFVRAKYQMIGSYLMEYVVIFPEYRMVQWSYKKK